MDNSYKRYGCNNRDEYLEMVADDYGITLDEVYAIADTLGPNEDFDGLLSVLDDM